MDIRERAEMIATSLMDLRKAGRLALSVAGKAAFLEAHTILDTAALLDPVCDAALYDLLVADMDRRAIRISQLVLGLEQHGLADLDPADHTAFSLPLITATPHA